MPDVQPGQLVFFADDWGRHPSSAQYIVRHLLPRHRALWVNTIGTRAPRLRLEDAGKVASKLYRWLAPRRESVELPANLKVVHPKMYPGFRAPWQRAVNRASMTNAISRALRDWPAAPRVAVTTLPVTADLIGAFDVDRWVYYCVDDFSVWPGIDETVMEAMERDLLAKVDRVIVVSDTLRERVASMGRSSTLITHGIEPDHWAAGEDCDTEAPSWWPRTGPVMLFWGVVDRRLDTEWCTALATEVGHVVLLGPQQLPDPSLMQHQRIVMPGAVPYAELPALARRSDLLLMPYADLPVTRAMQPLKLKEYLASGRPALVRALPATTQWADTADVVASLERAVTVSKQRIAHGIPDAQRQARAARLPAETWVAKAKRFEQSLFG